MNDGRAAGGWLSWLRSEAVGVWLDEVENPGAPSDGLDGFRLSLREWLANGMPAIEMGHKLGASFAATGWPDVAELKLPWTAFVVGVPRGLVSVTTNGRPASVVAAIVLVDKSKDDGWANFVVLGDRGTSPGRWTFLRSPARKVGEFAGDQDVSDVGGGHNDCRLDEPSQAARALRAVGRIILSSAAEMSTRPVPSIAATRAKTMSAITSGRAPTGEVFKLTRDVRVDVREAVRQWVGGGGSSPLVRSMVRGHWKRQAHGPGGTDRKWIHVEPYWRGPEDAPIAVRSHILSAARSS